MNGNLVNLLCSPEGHKLERGAEKLPEEKLARIIQYS